MNADGSSLKSNPRDWSRSIPILVVLAGALAYSNSLGNPFVFDDGRIIRACSTFSSLWPLRPRSVTDLTFCLNATLCGSQPICYRIVNVVIHLLAATCLYGIVRRTLLLSRFQKRYAATTAAWLAGVSAILWTVHPLQTESVIYVCQRYESLMGMFYLLALYCFIRGCSSERHKRWWFDGALAACILGTGSKGVMITVPVVLLLYDYVFLSEGSLGPVRSRVKIHVANFSAGIGISLLLALLYRENSIATYGDLSRMLAYLMTQFRVVLYYLRLAACPYPLCLDYGWGMVDGWREVVLPASVVLSLIGVTVLLLWRRHPGGFLGAWIFVILAPTSSFFPIDDVIFEHRMYLPLAGVIVLAVMAVYEGLSACRSPSGRALVWARWIAMVFVASYIALTMLRNVDYRSERSLWSDVVRKQPDNLRARNDLAVAFCEQGDFEKANVHFDYVLRKTEGTTSKRVKKRMPYAIANNSPQFNRCRAFANRGVMESVRGRLDMAISNFVAAVEVYPYESDVLLKLRHTLLRTGIPPDKVDDEIHRLIRQEGN